MNINIMIGYDDHTSTYKVCDHMATAILLMDDPDAINDYITSQANIVTDTWDAQNANVFLDLNETDLELFHADLKEELTISP